MRDERLQNRSHNKQKSVSTLHITLDTRPNGPARASFEFAGGQRPERIGSTNGWTAHHLYSGKFPYIGCSDTTHAVKLGNHFTQSAGIITAHPIADALCDEYPFFAWLLRALSYQKFGYDPDGVFSNKRDDLGFEISRVCMVFYRLADTKESLTDAELLSFRGKPQSPAAKGGMHGHCGKEAVASRGRS